MTYELAFGQKINTDKSTITFSPSFDLSCKTSIFSTLGLQSVQSHDKYLGFPTVVCRNKKKFFEEIKDRVWKRVQGWHVPFFLA